MEIAQAQLYVVDASSLLNLVACRRFREITRSISGRLVAANQAATEVRYVRRGGAGRDAQEREPVDLNAFQEEGLLTVVTLETPDEMARFVSLASELDDGEAASGAIAVSRGGVLVTDDRKARRVIARVSPGTQLLTTSQVSKAWVDDNTISDSALAHVLIDVEERANFRPSGHDPLWEWWTRGRGSFQP